MRILEMPLSNTDSGDLEETIEATFRGIARWQRSDGVWTARYANGEDCLEYDHALTEQGFFFTESDYSSSAAYFTSVNIARDRIAELYEAIIAQQISAEDV
jgi:hypothetical protein